MGFSLSGLSAPRGVALVVSILLAVTSHAADMRQQIQLHPPAARAEALAAVMQEELALTPEQAVAVRTTAEKYAGETDAALARYQRRELKQQLQVIAKARDAEFGKILTAEQYQAYSDGKREFMRNMRARMKGEDG